MAFVTGYLAEQKPMVLETAVLFKKPWSKTEPTYYLESVSEWIVFPFELGEVNRQRVAMETDSKA
jgi:hypothetical protein